VEMLSDGERLLRAVAADPAADDPRLQYADWVQDQPDAPCPACKGAGRLDADHRPGTIECALCRGRGCRPGENAARAEFIRVQIEMARTEECPHAWALKDDPACRYCQLRDLNDWYQHNPVAGRTPPAWRADPWVGLRGAHALAFAATWRRGFVADLSCSAEDWVTFADRLYWHPQCTACRGTGVRTVPTPYDSLAWDAGEAFVDEPCEACGGNTDALPGTAARRDGTGLNARPRPATAEPLEFVRLTTPLAAAARLVPEGFPPRSMVRRVEEEYLSDRWPHIIFRLTADRPARRGE